MARWTIELGGTHAVPLINLLNDQLLDAPLVHMHETTVAGAQKRQGTDHRSLDVGASRRPPGAAHRAL
jgi:hypothetical protein